jgi:3-hexulose-6-phosphate synthase
MVKNKEVHKRKLSPETFLSEFHSRSPSHRMSNTNITTSQLSDAMRKVTGQNGVLPGLKPVQTSFKIVGKATTVKTSANDWGTIVKGIYAAEKKDILVISCERDDPAVWGEIASNAAQKHGLAGTIVYGAARDIAGIKKLGYPVFSREIIPNAGSPSAEGEVNTPITCGRTTVNPGDFIMGDECGVVSVPLNVVEEVFETAFHILNNENSILRKIDKGESFKDILGMK